MHTESGRMTAFEMFRVIADSHGEVWDQARIMIGGIDTLALLLVTSALNGTTENPDFKETAKLMDMSEGGLRKKVDNICFKTVSQV
jgi:hypothetical protein